MRPVTSGGETSVEPYLLAKPARAQRASRVNLAEREGDAHFIRLAALEMRLDGVSPYRALALAKRMREKPA